jgi:hypothetical protein
LVSESQLAKAGFLLRAAPALLGALILKLFSLLEKVATAG